MQPLVTYRVQMDHFDILFLDDILGFNNKMAK